MKSLQNGTRLRLSNGMAAKVIGRCANERLVGAYRTERGTKAQWVKQEDGTFKKMWVPA